MPKTSFSACLFSKVCLRRRKMLKNGTLIAFLESSENQISRPKKIGGQKFQIFFSRKTAPIEEFLPTLLFVIWMVYLNGYLEVDKDLLPVILELGGQIEQERISEDYVCLSFSEIHHSLHELKSEYLFCAIEGQAARSKIALFTWKAEQIIKAAYKIRKKRIVHEICDQKINHFRSSHINWFTNLFLLLLFSAVAGVFVPRGLLSVLSISL